MVSIPESHRDLLVGRQFAELATLMPDGSPQVTPVWIDFDGSCVVINTVEGRQKAANLDRDPRLALAVFDHANPYRYLQVRGHVVEKTREGADDHIDRLASRYLDQARYPFRRDGEVRVIYRIEPDRIQAVG